jgi:Ribbon-helix-helix protein, copG family
MLRCVRTTIRLDDQLLREAKALAAHTGRTLTQVIQDALQQSLAQGTDGGSDEPLRLPTFGGRGVRPGVDLDDSAGLTELMDGRARP